MSYADYADRIATTYGVVYQQVQTGKVEEFYMGEWKRMLYDMSRFRFDVIDEPSLNAGALTVHQRAVGYDLLIFDHLHRVDVSGHEGRDRRERMEAEIKGLTTLAR